MEIVRHDVKCSLSLILTGRGGEISEGWSRLQRIECAFDQLIDFEDLLRDALNGQVVNVQEVPRMLIWFTKHLGEKSDGEPVSNDIAVLLRNVSFEDMSQLVAILRVLLEHRVYLPESANHGKLCEAIVLRLSSFQMPCDPKRILEFNDNAAKIQGFLGAVCSGAKTGENNNLIFTCLQTLYRIISDTKRKQEPGPGLATVLQLVEPSVIPHAVQWILMESHCDLQLVQALKVLCTWLPKWSGDRLGIWVMEFILGLEKQQKYSILLEVTQGTLDFMFLSLLLPITRQNASAIVFHVLKRQGSPALLQNIVKNVQIFLSYQAKEDSESSRECIQNVVDHMKALMLRFPGYKMYTSLQNIFPVLPRMHVVHDICNGPVWMSDTKECDSIIESSRSLSGKVGLSNLGNTCYMNSILQALFMTNQFRQEVLNYNPSNDAGEQIVLKKLQNLFALLLYSKRISLAPTEILLVSRPTYFLPGQQQDSSEFLCHLLDVLHEQEKSANMNSGSNDCAVSSKCKIEKQADEVLNPVQIRFFNAISQTEETEGTITRWTTEEDLTNGIILQKETESLTDFAEGDVAQTQQLSDSHSDSTDSGIQSVGGEETNTHTSLVHRVLGGESKITYQCAQCDTSSHNTDKFRDLQLCFPEEIQENQEVSVQDLINYYLTPEKLTGENKYRCDKCTKLCDAQRIIRILQAPVHLILTLKHFRYDFDSRLRTKLRHKVTYNETIQLPVSALPCTTAETYHLYAAVVHSGYSMDYGHYFTYACDSKQNWYKFNDSYVSNTTLDDFKNLKPPDTPYVLFYKRSLASDRIYEDKPELSTLSRHLQELVAKDTAEYMKELRYQAEKSQRGRHSATSLKRNDNSDDENPPPSNCRGTIDIPANRFLC